MRISPARPCKACITSPRHVLGKRIWIASQKGPKKSNGRTSFFLSSQFGGTVGSQLPRSPSYTDQRHKTRRTQDVKTSRTRPCFATELAFLHIDVLGIAFVLRL